MGACLPCSTPSTIRVPIRAGSSAPSSGSGFSSGSSHGVDSEPRASTIIGQLCRDSEANSASAPTSCCASDDDSSDRIVLKVSALSGQQLAEVSLAPSRRVEVLKRQVQAACGVWADEQHLVFHDAVLAADRTLAASGITRDGMLTMVHVPRPYVLGGKTDGSLSLWDLSTGDCAESLPRAHQQRLLSVAVDWPARQALTTGNDRTLIIWDLAQGVPVHVVDGLFSSMSRAAVDWEEQRVLGGFSDGSVFLLQFKEGHTEPPMRVGSHQRCVTSLEVEWAANRAFTASYDRVAILWDIQACEALCLFEGHQGVILTVSLGWSYGLAASGAADGMVILWDLRGKSMGQNLTTLRGHRATVRAITVDWSQQRVLTGSSDRNLGLWQFEQTAPAPDAASAHMPITSPFPFDLAGTPARSSWTCRLVAILRGHQDQVNLISAEWSAQMAVSAASDRTLIMWDLLEHAPLRVLYIPGSAEVTVMNVNWDAVDRSLTNWRSAVTLAPDQAQEQEAQRSEQFRRDDTTHENAHPSAQ